MSARHFELLKKPGLIIPEAALRRRSIVYSGAPAATVAFLDFDQTTTGSGATHTGMNFGPIVAGKYIIVCVGNSSATVTSAVSVGGSAATPCVDVVGQNNSARSSIWIAPAPAATSGTVTLTLGAGGVCSVALYSVIGLLSLTPIDTATGAQVANPSTINLGLNVNPFGFSISTAYGSGSTGTTASWTGVTNVDMNQRVSSGTAQHSTASYVNGASSGVHAITASLGASIIYCGVSASFR